MSEDGIIGLQIFYGDKFKGAEIAKKIERMKEEFYKSIGEEISFVRIPRVVFTLEHDYSLKTGTKTLIEDIMSSIAR